MKHDRKGRGIGGGCEDVPEEDCGVGKTKNARRRQRATGLSGLVDRGPASAQYIFFLSKGCRAEITTLHSHKSSEIKHQRLVWR
jgi:hypothetical protein